MQFIARVQYNPHTQTYALLCMTSPDMVRVAMSWWQTGYTSFDDALAFALEMVPTELTIDYCNEWPMTLEHMMVTACNTAVQVSLELLGQDAVDLHERFVGPWTKTLCRVRDVRYADCQMGPQAVTVPRHPRRTSHPGNAAAPTAEYTPARVAAPYMGADPAMLEQEERKRAVA